MPTVTENDIQQLKDLITSGFNKLEVNQARLEEKVNALDKRLDIIESRVNGLTGWLIGILFVFVGGLLGLLGKIAFFPILDDPS
ncbi:MAG: hypothetical protein ACKOX2_04970 [Microcystaceae cyanobacterium]